MKVNVLTSMPVAVEPSGPNLNLTTLSRVTSSNPKVIASLRLELYSLRPRSMDGLIGLSFSLTIQIRRYQRSVGSSWLKLYPSKLV